jgi:dissimilatory sulfite reductase (desulfoviridin) alpha/beta subunit
MVCKNIGEKLKGSTYRNTVGYLIIMVIVSVIVSLSTTSGSFKSSKAMSESHKLVNASSTGLKTYVKFTGNQFLIINHSAFDWTNVRFEVEAAPVGKSSSEEAVRSQPVALSAPRIQAGGTYTVSTNPRGAGDGPSAHSSAPMPYHLKIWCDTPQGQSFWSGHWE